MTETSAASIAPPEGAACLTCGYSLRGLASRACPECGREFDPEVLTSMRVPRVPGTPTALELRLLEPVRWSHGPVRATLIAFGVIASWMPAPNPLPPLGVAIAWVVVAFPYFLRRMARRAVVFRYGLAPELLRVDRAGLWRMRRMFLIAFVVAVSQAPFLVNFAFSRPFLVRAARYWLTEAPSSANPPQAPRVYGLFLVTSSSASMRQVVFDTPGGRIVFRLNERGDDVEWVGVEHWWQHW